MNLLTKVEVKDFFEGHTLPCIKNFILLIECIIQCRTVCLYKCRDKVPTLMKKGKTSNMNSNYMRLIRFFKMKAVNDFITGIRTLLITIGEFDMTYLIVDRSNWKRGSKNINLLTIGSLLNQVFAPFYWIQLNKRGNSNIDDRKNLIEGVLALAARAGKSLQKSILLADREFIGQLWFEYLLNKNLSFVIRLREKMYFELQTFTGKKRTSLRSFRKYVERYGIYSIPMTLGEITYTFVMIKNPKHDPKEPYIYFISDLQDAKAIANHYLKRWKIECCFKNLKTNGFNIEDINLKSDKKIELMMGVLALTYLISVKEGILKHLIKPVPLKRYKDGKKYPAISIFRMGFAIVQNMFDKINRLIAYIDSLLKPCMDTLIVYEKKLELTKNV